MTQNYQSLKQNNEKVRVEFPGRAPKEFGGMLKPGGLNKYSLIEIYRSGTWLWTKISMSTIIVAAKELGWETYVNLLGRYQLPACKGRIDELCGKYNIPNTFVGYQMMSHVWGKGCMFDVASSGGRTLETETETSMCNNKCPQLECLREMGLENHPETRNLYLWCDSYDNMFLGHMNDHCWYSHVSCLCEQGREWCVSYLRDTCKPVKEKPFYSKIKDMNDIGRKTLDEHLPKPEDGLLGLTWRNVEDVDMVRIARDGPYIKSRIAVESMLCAVREMGWRRFLDIYCQTTDKGFDDAAAAWRRWAGIEGRGPKDALAALAVNYFAMDFEDHVVSYFYNDYAEIVAPRCKMIDSAKRMGLEDCAQDMCLWCDYFHNHAVKGVNPGLTVTHTHCLGKGDSYCRAVIR